MGNQQIKTTYEDINPNNQQDLTCITEIKEVPPQEVEEIKEVPSQEAEVKEVPPQEEVKELPPQEEVKPPHEEEEPDLVEANIDNKIKDIFNDTYSDVNVDELKQINVSLKDANTHYYHPGLNRVYTYAWASGIWHEKLGIEKDRLLKYKSKSIIEDTTNIDDIIDEDYSEDSEDEVEVKDDIQLPSAQMDPAILQKISKDADTNAEAIATYLQEQRKVDMEFFDQVTQFNISKDINDPIYSIVSFENAVKIIQANINQTVRQGYIMMETIIEDSDRDCFERSLAIKYLLKTNAKEQLQKIEKFEYDMIYKDLDSKRKFHLLMNFIDCPVWSELRERTVEWGERLQRDLQWIYFHEIANYIRYRILSGQWLLSQRSMLEKERRKYIQEIFEDIMNNEEEDDNIRADVADVLSNYGDLAYKEIAKEIIKELGFKEGGYTVYDNAQNVHDDKIRDCIIKFIENELVRDKIPTTKYETKKEDGTTTIFERIQTIIDITEAMTKLVTDYIVVLEPSKSKKLIDALDRIALDSSTFTGKRMTAREILQRVWNRIQRKEPDIKNSMTQRLIEELIDMEGTCSSGHMERIVNILSTYDFEINIGFENQIIANIKGRFEARIKELDDDLQADILMAMSSEGDEKQIFINFAKKVKDELYKEMFEEFVNEGHIGREEFDTYFKKGYQLFTGIKEETKLPQIEVKNELPKEEKPKETIDIQQAIQEALKNREIVEQEEDIKIKPTSEPVDEKVDVQQVIQDALKGRGISLPEEDDYSDEPHEYNYN
jgi:hypothetical protein